MIKLTCKCLNDDKVDLKKDTFILCYTRVACSVVKQGVVYEDFFLLHITCGTHFVFGHYIMEHQGFVIVF